MLDTLQALLGLQEIDRQIFRVEAELRRLPAELAARREALERRTAELEEQRRAAFELRMQIKEIEDVTTQQRQRQRKLEGEAMRAKTDAALLAAYDHEIRSLKRTIGQAEEDGLQLVESVEEIEGRAAALEAELAEERRVFDEFRRNVERETAEAEVRVAELHRELEKHSAQDVPPDHLDLYRRLLSTREGEALAELQGQICQGCYVAIPKNLAVRLARGVDLVQCPSCDRILYVRY